MSFTIIKQKDRFCPYCVEAEKLLLQYNKDYIVKILSLDDLRVTAKKANMKTIPIIYCDDKLIGGLDELKEYINETSS